MVQQLAHLSLRAEMRKRVSHADHVTAAGTWFSTQHSTMVDRSEMFLIVIAYVGHFSSRSIRIAEAATNAEKDTLL